MILTFPLKHWITTVIAGPVLLTLFKALFVQELIFQEVNFYYLINCLAHYLGLVLVGIIMSLPILVIYYFIHAHLLDSRLNDTQIRVILISFVVGTAVLLLWNITDSTFRLPMIFSYSVIAIVSGLRYSLSK